MEEFNFILRHIPFWAIPLAMILIECGLIFKFKGNKKVYTYCFAVTAICGLAVLYYIYAGGGSQSVQTFQNVLPSAN